MSDTSQTSVSSTLCDHQRSEALMPPEEADVPPIRLNRDGKYEPNSGCFRLKGRLAGLGRYRVGDLTKLHEECDRISNSTGWQMPRQGDKARGGNSWGERS